MCLAGGIDGIVSARAPSAAQRNAGVGKSGVHDPAAAVHVAGQIVPQRGRVLKDRIAPNENAVVGLQLGKGRRGRIDVNGCNARKVACA